MRKIVEYFILNPVWANAIIVLTGIFGVISFFSMNQSFFPETDPLRIWVNVTYPGASPIEMEEGVTIKIEQALKGMEGIDEITSSSKENYAQVTITALENVDLDELVQEVNNTVNSINSFPAGAEKPIIIKQKTNGMAALAATVGLSGTDDLFEMKEISDNIEDELLSSDQITDVSVFGLPELEISVEVKEEDLLRYNLTFNQIATKIQQNNLDLSGGTIKTNEEEIIIRSKERSTDVDKIKMIPITSTLNGERILLRDIANVKLQFADVANSTKIDSRRGMVFNITKLPDQDMAEINDYVHKYIANFNEEFESKGYKLSILFDASEGLNSRINLLMKNGGQGLIIVLIALGFFLSLRLSFWVAFGIPFSLLGMIAIGILYGMTINMISLFGMILVVGILVDDGIVISENIYTHYKMGKSSYRAALDGTMEVMPSVFTSVITTVIAFGALLFITGGMKMMAEMAFVVVACLLFSLIEAFLVLPSHLSHKSILEKSNVGWYNKVRNFIENLIDNARDYYGILLARILKNFYVYTYVPLFFVIIVAYMIGSGKIQTTFFPHIPSDQINIEFAFKPGETMSQSEAYANEIENIIKQVAFDLKEATGDELISNITNSVGQTGNLEETGTHTGKVTVFLEVEGREDITGDSIESMIKNRITPPSGVEKFFIGAENRFGKPVHLSISANDLDQLITVRNEVIHEFEKMPDLINISSNSAFGNRELLINLKPKAYSLGLTYSDVVSQVRNGYFGREVQRLIKDKDEVKVWVRYPDSDKKTISQLENMKIVTPSGERVALSDIADYEIERGLVNITHINTEKEISIYAGLSDPKLSSSVVTADINNTIVNDLKAKYPKVKFRFKGQAERAAKTGASLGVLFIVAIILIFLVLTLNFNSFYQARLVMTVVPAGFMGGALGHYFYGQQISILSMFGFIALLGILINDAVVLMDKFNQGVKAGLSVHEAALDAGKARFRAIILTSITTVAGLLPLMGEKDVQALFLKPMALSVAFGVLFGTFFILLFLPALICFFNDMRRMRLWLWDGKSRTERDAEPVIKLLKREKEFLASGQDSLAISNNEDNE